MSTINLRNIESLLNILVLTVTLLITSETNLARSMQYSHPLRLCLDWNQNPRCHQREVLLRIDQTQTLVFPPYSARQEYLSSPFATFFITESATRSLFISKNFTDFSTARHFCCRPYCLQRTLEQNCGWWNARTLERRNAGTPERRNAGTPEY